MQAFMQKSLCELTTFNNLARIPRMTACAPVIYHYNIIKKLELPRKSEKNVWRIEENYYIIMM